MINGNTALNIVDDERALVSIERLPLTTEEKIEKI
jgi:hypothetical protein